MLILVDIQSIESFYVSEVDTLYSGPQLSFLGVPTGPNTSSLTVYALPLAYVSRNPKVIQDYRDKSVVGGFSSLGGLWSFVCGMFSMVFGCSVIRVLFGTCFCDYMYPKGSL